MGRYQKKNDRKGFSLMEVLVVIIIVSVVASLALPSFSTHVERVRASEGAQFLTVLLAAQERYRLDNNVYATDVANVDVDLPNASNFTLPPNFFNSAARVASIVRSDGAYTLCINSTGVISCSGSANICAAYAAGGAGICP